LFACRGRFLFSISSFFFILGGLFACRGRFLLGACRRFRRRTWRRLSGIWLRGWWWGLFGGIRWGLRGRIWLRGWWWGLFGGIRWGLRGISWVREF
jgi:hypothetical protein